MPARLQLIARTGHPDFLDLPWDEPLEEWKHAAARRGRARDPPPRRSLRRVRGRAGAEAVRPQGAAARAGPSRVPAAARPRRRRDAGGRCGRCRLGPRRRPRRDPDHPPPRLLAPVPDPLRARQRPRPAPAAARRGRRAPRPPAPRRVLLGRLLALEHALPPRCRRARRVPRRRRDGRAASAPLRRAAPPRPRDRGGERRGRARGRRSRARPRRRAATGGDGRRPRRALRVALGRADCATSSSPTTRATRSTTGCTG